jgi:hypothetical protein
MRRLQDMGVPVLPAVVNHDDSPMGVAREKHDGVSFRSVYFRDPNGIMLEFCATCRTFGPEDVKHEPARAIAREPA